MSLFGALDTSGSGLGAQAAAFTNISDDVANSQSTGFKRVDTSFEDYFTTSNATVNNSGAVVAKPDYVNTIQGTVTQTDNPLAMAIKDQGFFPVSNQTSTTSTGLPVFDPLTAYSRDGNFQMNKFGYLVNDVGQYLNAWPVSNGTVERNTLSPIQINQQASFAPVATTTSTLSANLPPTAGTTPITTSVDIYDAQGAAHQLNLTFTPIPAGQSIPSPVGTGLSTPGNAPTTASANTWSLTVTDDASPANTIGGGIFVFGAHGTIQNVYDAPPTAASSNGSVTFPTGQAGITLDTNYPGTGSSVWNTGSNTPNYQQIALGLGTVGGTDGITQFAASQYTQNGLTQNGIPPGTYTSTSTDSSGNISVNYSNGQSVAVGRVPVITFEAPDQLQRQNGQAFTQTVASGQPQPHDAGTGGAGGIAVNSLEASNVDIGTEFTNLIVAQQAYTANAKVVTTSSQLLQATINMVQ